MPQFERDNRKYALSEEEAAAHQETERRKKILEGKEGEEARALAAKELAKLTPEEIARAKKAGQERTEQGK